MTPRFVLFCSVLICSPGLFGSFDVDTKIRTLLCTKEAKKELFNQDDTYTCTIEEAHNWFHGLASEKTETHRCACAGDKLSEEVYNIAGLVALHHEPQPQIHRCRSTKWGFGVHGTNMASTNKKCYHHFYPQGPKGPEKRAKFKAFIEANEGKIFDFVLVKDGEVRFMLRESGFGNRRGHSSMISIRSQRKCLDFHKRKSCKVMFAGQMDYGDGELIIDNGSGHFRPKHESSAFIGPWFAKYVGFGTYMNSYARIDLDNVFDDDYDGDYMDDAYDGFGEWNHDKAYIERLKKSIKSLKQRLVEGELN